MNKSTLKIFGDNKEEINSRIREIENSLVGVEYHHADRENYVEGLPFPIIDDKKSLAERMAEHNIPGLSIAVINDFKIEWSKTFGYRNVNTKEPITLETIFQAASITKPIMSTLALHLVEKGILELDEPVNNKLKDFRIPDNEFTKEKAITLRHLLSHTAGINLPNRGFGRDEGSSPTLLQTLKGEVPAKNDPVEVTFKPGSKCQYSNFGYIIIEKLLHDVTNKKLHDIAKEILFEPLGMKNSFLLYPTEELQQRMICPHNYYNGKVYKPHVGLLPRIFGCGGLITTPTDIATFAIELMNAYKGKSEKILSQKIAKEMVSHQVTLNPIYYYDSTAQGLGIFLFESENDFFFGHRGGGEPGSSSLFMANPESGQGFVAMANSNVGHQLFQSIKFTLAKEYKWSMWRE